MSASTTDIRIVPLPTVQDVLTEVLRDGARRMLAQAVEADVAAWIDAHAHLKDQAGRQQVVRNGHLPERTIQTGIGPVEVEQPRVRDRRPAGDRESFTSAILPPYLRKTRSLEGLIPGLYPKGISTGDSSESLQALLGPGAPGLSAATVTRLKAAREAEREAWAKRSLAGKHYVYVWDDGVHFNIRLEGGRQCILVLMGATAEGKKELIAVEGTAARREGPWPGVRAEPGDRCWVHETANVLDKPPKGSQPKAKKMLHEIDLAEGREEAVKAFDLFVRTYEAKYKATECPSKYRDVSLEFYDFPAEHRVHIRASG